MAEPDQDVKSTSSFVLPSCVLHKSEIVARKNEEDGRIMFG